MKLGDKIRELREGFGLTQGHLARSASVSQGYLSQLENGEVKNPSAAVLLRVAQAMHVDPDVLFESAGYPTVRTLRQIYQDYESTIDADLLSFLSRLPRNRQRRLLLLLEGMEGVLSPSEEEEEDVEGLVWGRKKHANDRAEKEERPPVRLSGAQN